MRLFPWVWIAAILALFFLPAAGGVAATVDPDYSTTYTITLFPDGSALWRVEYRTLLLSQEDRESFATYTRDLSGTYLPQFRSLLEQSAAQAAIATGRHMAVTDVAGTAAVQTSPTGQYGVVVYTLRWDGFFRPGQSARIGDAFAGGLYLARGNTLIVQLPAGYTAGSVEPAPDASRDGLIWYGQRSFGAGEPRIVLEQETFPLLPVAVAAALLILISFSVFVLFRWRRDPSGDDAGSSPPPPLSDAEILNLEEKILRLLAMHDAGMFQSAIVSTLGLPKSTVSSALNNLHARGAIIKVRKGRENLIRLP